MYAQTFVRPTASNELEMQLCFTNKTGAAIPFSMQSTNPISFRGKMYNVQTTGKADYLYADGSDGLYASFGQTRFNAQRFDNSQSPTLWTKIDSSIDLNNFALPAYAMGVLKVKLTEVSTAITPDWESQFTLHPNPCGDIARIQLPLSYRLTSLQVFDIQGKATAASYRIQSHEILVDAASLRAGIYMIRLDDGVRVKMLKLVKR